MKVWFGQIYIEPGATFPFSHHFQKRLSGEITRLVTPSDKYVEKFGKDFELMFRGSAKAKIDKNEIRGPAVFKKAKDVEYTIFLPYDTIVSRKRQISQTALRHLFDGIYHVFDSLEINTAKIRERQEVIIASICSDPIMFDDEEDW